MYGMKALMRLLPSQSVLSLVGHKPIVRETPDSEYAHIGIYMLQSEYVRKPFWHHLPVVSM